MVTVVESDLSLVSVTQTVEVRGSGVYQTVEVWMMNEVYVDGGASPFCHSVVPLTMEKKYPPV
jgi:hypothetical protein